MKNPLTPAGIEPATFRFVAQHLNHCPTAVPLIIFIFNLYMFRTTLWMTVWYAGWNSPAYQTVIHIVARNM